MARQTATLDLRFAQFHQANPHVYEALLALALAARAAGEHGNIALLTERLRGQIRTSGDAYALNNSYRRFYARLLMEREPSLRGFFKTRQAPVDVEYRRRLSRVTHAPRLDHVHERGRAPRLF